ncbi:MAG: bifunctional pyr operon transcriptional regulator/uracil phosphoribosyltransferase PyrR [Candidatus Cloacimonetes bacterium]|jgi:pyrimidine operon attenuation protein/uracil phosphoribosyltransferase|nr:bifunctional pyr operon transcriptional regulator/uracil phosphoribosyltransferase PyrR [Candidatus Cloacimonadota bacterium]MBT4575732.1 bifunctional pyr operon transcriptional regulator/uracil phosphoribosyltransferase PyrR [Candidatus Cloacimonadota bacterium]MBT5419550.1 bifunctional pyr operon transcriptional regulator/uracil phosphoribosyltransferase PyrR [Candidatus Cloacimonadota bacterium]
MKTKSKIMDVKAIERSMRRIALEIVEYNKSMDDVYLVGIKSRGVPMADRLSKYLSEIEKLDVKTGVIDISLYRDDLSKVAENPVHKGSHIDFEVENAKIILIDDVLYTGRTVRAAIDAVLDIGRPKEIQLCVLIDRGHKELPIHADYVGRYVPTSGEEIIKVSFVETDEEESVKIVTLD